MIYPGIPPVLFHTGMVVHRLEPAMEALGAALGVTWRDPVATDRQVWARDGTVMSRHGRITFSREGPHFIELMEEQDNPCDELLSGGPRIHHLGLWTEDLAGEVRRLEALGFPSEMSGYQDGIHPVAFSMHHNPHGGLWLEILAKERVSPEFLHVAGRSGHSGAEPGTPWHGAG